MHPDLLLALSRERQDDLNRRSRFNDEPHLTGPAIQPVSRTRIRLGRLLVSVGKRLAEPGPSGWELLHNE
jgi:hypothetical protein